MNHNGKIRVVLSHPHNVRPKIRLVKVGGCAYWRKGTSFVHTGQGRQKKRCPDAARPGSSLAPARPGAVAEPRLRIRLLEACGIPVPEDAIEAVKELEKKEREEADRTRKEEEAKSQKEDKKK